MSSHHNIKPQSEFLLFTLSSICFFFFFFFFFSNPAKATPTNPQFPCKPPHHNSYQFCNASLSTSTRSQSLLSLLSLPEKISALSTNFSGVPSLGIPPYEWWSESLHGIATNGPGVSFDGRIKSSTMFPQVLLTAASFNRTLWSEVASSVAVEGRAMYNSGQAGLTFWAPVVNVLRDPRWGRGQETPGEDPVVVSTFGAEYVKGFQFGGIWGNGVGERRALEENGSDAELMLSACCKHFNAYDLEDWGNFSRYSFDAKVRFFISFAEHLDFSDYLESFVAFGFCPSLDVMFKSYEKNDAEITDTCKTCFGTVVGISLESRIGLELEMRMSN